MKVLRGDKLAATYCNKNIITTEKLINLLVENLNNYYILSIINSKLVSFYFNKTIFSDTTETSRIMDDIYLKEIPLPKLNEVSQKPFIEKVEQIMKKKEQGQDTTELEKEIDRMVYQLYGLSREEIEVVEGK